VCGSKASNKGCGLWKLSWFWREKKFAQRLATAHMSLTEARLTHFHVKLSNFKAENLPPADLNGLADPYLELNFDQFKIVKTRKISKS
jgi:C2 domain